MYFKAVWCDGCEPYRNSALQYLPTDCGRRHVIAIVPGQPCTYSLGPYTFEEQSGKEDQDSTVKYKLGNKLVATNMYY